MNRLLLTVLAAGVLVLASPRARVDTQGRTHLPQVAMGESHTCMLSGAAIYCWGANGSGQLGTGDLNARTTATFIANEPAIAVVAGLEHTCMLRVGGMVSCWGANASGQLGDGTRTPRSTPAVVANVSGAVAIAAGARHTCALLVNGAVRCWGNNDNRQVSSALVGSVADAVDQGLTNVIAITSGDAHNCALLADGTARCWGRDVSGQLGDGDTVPSTRIVSVFGVANLTGIAAGAAHTCATHGDGRIFCWGSSGSGRLGASYGANQTAPVAVPGIANAVMVEAGNDHTCAVLADGSVRCWGANTFGQIGDGTVNNARSSPTVALGLNSVLEVAAGNAVSCAINADGSAHCWGLNTSGQLGNGTTSPSSTPSPVSFLSGGIGGRTVDTGFVHTCAARRNGQAACWGSVNGLNPQTVSGATGVVSIRTGDAPDCILTAQGIVRCWGNNSAGSVGDGTTTDRSSPVNVRNISNAVSIATGGGHGCAATADGKVYCWGEGSEGQLGTVTDKSLIPVEVPGVNNIVAVAGGFSFTCALRSNGTVWCWGSNDSGQLGDGTFASRPQPVQVPGLINVTGISAGRHHTCATLADGTARCWGANGGRLGNGNTNTSTTPSTVTAFTDVVQISAGSAHTCGLSSGSKLYCWGANAAGQLGSATANDSLTPTAVIEKFITARGSTFPYPLANAVYVSSGSIDQSCAILASGAVLCWGSNVFGQLGDGTNISSIRPVRANSFTANVAPKGELRTNGRLANLTVLLNCTVGEHAMIHLTLEQNQTIGQISTTAACTGHFEEIPVTVAGHGPVGFQPGEATARIEAIVRDRNVITEQQRWTRVVVLAPKQ